MLEGDLSAQSEVLSAVEEVFSKDISVLCLTSLPVPAAEKHAHIMMFPPPCFVVEVVLGR